MTGTGCSHSMCDMTAQIRKSPIGAHGSSDSTIRDLCRTPRATASAVCTRLAPCGRRRRQSTGKKVQPAVSSNLDPSTYVWIDRCNPIPSRRDDYQVAGRTGEQLAAYRSSDQANRIISVTNCSRPALRGDMKDSLVVGKGCGPEAGARD